MKPIKSEDQRSFEIIRNYIKAGGKPAPFVSRFCQKYEIEEAKFIHEMRKDADGWYAKLKRVGLVE